MRGQQRGTRFHDLRLHSDARWQFTSIRYGEGRNEIGARPPIGSIGDSFDYGLTESVKALYKTELIPVAGCAWRTIDELELATLTWVHWHNNERLHRYLGDVPRLSSRQSTIQPSAEPR
jgi:transposase InsO family protein